VSEPHPEEGLRVHATPPFDASFVTVAVRVTAEPPAFTVVAEPDWESETPTVLALLLFPPPLPQPFSNKKKDTNNRMWPVILIGLFMFLPYSPFTSTA
jgi:hypothetical protein